MLYPIELRARNILPSVMKKSERDLYGEKLKK